MNFMKKGVTSSTPLLQSKKASSAVEKCIEQDSKAKMFIGSGKAVLLGMIIDAILIIVQFVLLILYKVDYFMPFRRGFFCDDDSIRYPYKPSTVTNRVMYIGGLGIPIATIVLIEILQKSAKLRGTYENAILCGWHVPIKLQNIYIHVGPFLYGVLITEFITDFIKLYVGRLRPHFLDACLPDYNCTIARDPHMYVLNYTCTNPDLSINSFAIRESFPSGHASFGSYCALYTAVYLQRCLRCSFSEFLKPTIQLLLVLLTIYIAISRIEDNKHHWSDVLGGTVISVIVFMAILKLFPIYPTHSSDTVNDEEQCSFPEVKEKK